MLSALSSFLLRLWGWRFEVHPAIFEHKKYVLAPMPHTSNWDFPVGIMTRSKLKLYDVVFAAKSTLFEPPFGFIFRWLKGIPVYRDKSRNFVDQVVAEYNRRDVCQLVIAPEGTRSAVTKLKTGFYYIALGAKVPIIMVKLDWGSKTIGFSEPLFPSGDYEADLEIIKAYIAPTRGYTPENGIFYKKEE